MDTKLLKHVRCVSDSKSLQTELLNLTNWSSKWKLQFNTSKCTILEFGNCEMAAYEYFLNDLELARNDSHRDLGIVISTDLTWHKHYDVIIDSTRLVVLLLYLQ